MKYYKIEIPESMRNILDLVLIKAQMLGYTKVIIPESWCGEFRFVTLSKTGNVFLDNDVLKFNAACNYYKISAKDFLNYDLY